MNMTPIGFAVALLAASTASQTQAAPANLAAGDQTPRVYIVQLSDAPVATYTGTLSGLAATKPAKGARLNSQQATVTNYIAHLDRSRNAVLARLGGQVRPVHIYKTAFNGFSAVMSPAQAAQLMASGDVVSVVPSEVLKPDTTRTPGMLGVDAAGGIWSQLDALSRQVKGENVIVAMVDTGIWPEDPSFGDKLDASGKPVAYFGAGTDVFGPPPAKWAGTCVTGPGYTAAMCNNKLIGARFYSAGFLAAGGVMTVQEYASPRDTNGHGSHTASTAAGNGNVATLNGSGVPTGIMSGIAPRARLAIYKACWEGTTTALTGCHSADTVSAIDDAVADGADVINFSIAGTRDDYLDPVEIAFLNAAAAGVFVAAAAGNDGPGASTVAHISPWVTTVASGTVDRNNGGGDLFLGDGSVLSGFSGNFFGATSGNLVLGNNIPASGATEANANLCAANSLDSVAAAGKIVVCDRVSTNTLANRLAASAEVKRAGGIGMVLLYPDSATPTFDAHTLPAVNLALASRAAVRSYAVTNGATGLIGLSYNRPGVIAPVVSDFSSRGPGLADLNVMKPDILAPGSSIVAASRALLSPAQHDQVANGTFTPPAAVETKSGTSIASPHIAGAAALLRQLYPSWSPAAIKSALMTSTTAVKVSNGTADPVRWNYGAGLVNPNGSAIPSLAYDTDINDYGRFLCGQGLAPPAGMSKCDVLVSIRPWNLNLPSLQANAVPQTRTLTRTVTNVSAATRTYIATANLPGWDVVVTPSTLTLAPGASASFETRLNRSSAAFGTWTFGSLVWSDGVVAMSSPLNARFTSPNLPAQVNDVRASGKGTKIITAEAGFTGPLTVGAIGLVPAIVNTGNVLAKATKCFSFVVPAGVSFARYQLFQSETSGAGSDVDLHVFRSDNCTGTNVGTSASTSSDEIVTLENPTPATYSARVTGFRVPTTGADFKLNAWIVGPASGAQTLKAAGPASVYAAGAFTVGTSWNVPAGGRYMGLLTFTDASQAVIATTKMFVDNR